MTDAHPGLAKWRKVTSAVTFANRVANASKARDAATAEAAAALMPPRPAPGAKPRDYAHRCGRGGMGGPPPTPCRKPLARERDPRSAAGCA